MAAPVRFTSQDIQNLYNNLLASYTNNTDPNNPNNISQSLRFNNAEFQAYVDALQNSTNANNTTKIDNLEKLLKQLDPNLMALINRLPDSNTKSAIFKLASSNKYYTTLYSLSSYTSFKVFNNIEKYQRYLHSTILALITKFTDKIARLSARTPSSGTSSSTETPRSFGSPSSGTSTPNPFGTPSSSGTSSPSGTSSFANRNRWIPDQVNNLPDNAINPQSYRDLLVKYDDLRREYIAMANTLYGSMEFLEKAKESLSNTDMKEDMRRTVRNIQSIKNRANSTTNNINTVVSNLNNRIQSAGSKKVLKNKLKK